MDHRQRRDHRLVVQVDVVLADLVREQHALVDDACASTSTARRTPCRAAGSSAWIAWPGALADDVELALERVLVHVARPAADEHLADDRLDLLGPRGQPAVVGRARRASRAAPGPRPAIARSISCSQAIRDAGSCGRKTMPTPYWPSAGSVMPSSPQARRRNASGIWIRMPAPSPCSGSAPVAPRCVRFSRIASALRDDRRGVLRPLMWAMKPRPQASCSCAGS